MEPRSFSFNNPFGACPECFGLGYKMEFDVDLMIPDKSLECLLIHRIQHRTHIIRRSVGRDDLDSFQTGSFIISIHIFQADIIVKVFRFWLYTEVVINLSVLDTF